MAYALPADLIVFVHLAFIVFVVGGELLVIVGAPLRWAWIRNRIFRCAHLLAIVFVAVNAVLGILCPLTIWEAQLRQRAGQAFEEDISFVGRLVRDVIYYELPEWVFATIYVLFALAVVATLILVPPRWRSDR